MRVGLQILIFLGLVIGLIFLWESIKKWTTWGKTEFKTSHHQVIQKISSLGKMELVKYNFRDIVEQEIVQQLLPNPKALLIIEGEAVGCIDMRALKPEDITEKADTLLIKLPHPEICYHKIDHQKSKIYETSFAFMNEELLLNEAFKKAEQQVLNGAIANGMLENTKKNARLILSPMLSTIAAKPVKIVFDKK